MESDVRDERPGKSLCAAEDEFGDYNVFISHRGPDTKTGFVGFLYEALKRAGLHPFLDCKSIKKGQDAWTCIDHAIQSTPLVVVIFSKSFAHSEWCLRELHALLVCPSMKVFPVFYKIRPCEVSFPESGQLAVGFAKLKERHGETLVEEWKADMQAASKLNGWEYKAGTKRLEIDLVHDVVGKMFELANKPLPLDVGDHIVGLKQVAKTLMQIVFEKKVLMLGLWGMGGIGKSTLARELYNQLFQRFDASCYVEDVAEKVKQGGVTGVQNVILDTLCEKECIVNKSRGKAILEERLPKRRILLVLDDVDDRCDMGYLMSRKMLKEGSMCIVTSRNRDVFEKLTSFRLGEEVHTHDVQLLGPEDSRVVFARHAFGGDVDVPPEFGSLVRDVSVACGGVPLVLKVCGSLLGGEEDSKIWKEVLKKLNCGTIMDETKIFECLRISYDSLQKEHQEMFLDIACALLGQPVDYAKRVWRSQGWSATLGLHSLVERALIQLVEGSVHGVYSNLAFGMHDHLRDMGRAIATQERSSICKHLWGLESLSLLKTNEALPASLETLVIPPNFDGQVDLSPFQRLRILICKNSLLMSPPPKSVRWFQYSSESFDSLIPSPRSLENSGLVVLSLSHAMMKRFPKSYVYLKNLEVLNLDGCYKLLELPSSFGLLSNLEELTLSMTRIQRLPDSFGSLRSLEVFDISFCEELVGLPDSFGSLQSLKNLKLSFTRIQSLPDSFGSLRSLEVLNMSSCKELVGLPDSFGSLQSLKYLDLSHSKIQSLPDSFGSLRSLEVFNISFIKKLVGLPDSFGSLQSLKYLDLSHSKIQSLPDSFGSLRSLKCFNIRLCEELVGLPDSFRSLQNLKDLDLSYSRI